MTEKIYVGRNNEKIELQGLELEEFLEQRRIDQAEIDAQELLKTSKDSARASALAKLAALGLTEEEIAAL
jgi:hypothetical protein